MKKNIHPEYHELVLQLTNGETFTTFSTSKSGKIILDSDPTIHPAWTGSVGKNINKNAGKVASFNKKFGFLGKTE